MNNRQLAMGNGQWAMSKRFFISHRPFTYFSLLIASCIFTSCNSDFVQKERGYFRIQLPQKNYQVFDKPGFPYTFEYPVYATVVSDSTFFGEKAENPYWINLVFPQFDGELHLSYKEIGQNKFDTLIGDAFKMAYKQHTQIASAIKPVKFELANNVSGIYFSLKGNAATANQFFATDSAKHFLRGALYFNAPPNEDSLRPVNNFLREDMQHLIGTLRWR